MNNKINKYLTNEMGECWHQFDCCPTKDCAGINYYCYKCDKDFEFSYDSKNKHDLNVDLFTHEGFFKLWNWAKEQSWFRKFIHYDINKCVYDKTVIKINLIDPETFANKLYEYMTGENYGI